jgi:hypothetical protein
VLGVRDDQAPNALLVRWARPDIPRPTRRGLPAFLRERFARDTISVADLHEYVLAEDDWELLGDVEGIEWLRVPTTTVAQDIDKIGRMAKLRGLSLKGAALLGSDLSPIAGLADLEWLDLSLTAMTTESFTSLGRLEKLETLYLDGAGTDDEWVRHISDLALPRLRSLSLQYSSISDVALRDLCQQYDLEYLGLFRATQITSDSVPHIGRLKKLRLLGIGLSGLSGSDVEELERLLPQCVIDDGG